jgi:hypothetical protein
MFIFEYSPNCWVFAHKYAHDFSGKGVNLEDAFELDACVNCCLSIETAKQLIKTALMFNSVNI